jgi:hypothetical protein
MMRVRGAIVLAACHDLSRAVYRREAMEFNCAILTDLVTHGLALSFSMLTRIAFSDRFGLFICARYSSAT